MAATATLSQEAMFEAVREKYPNILSESIYVTVPLPKPLNETPLSEKRSLFLLALHEMNREIESGKDPADVAYDNSQARLWSFGLQPMWEVCADKQQSRLLGIESLLALHMCSWGVYPILDVLDSLLADELEAYLQFKTLEIKAAVSALLKYPELPSISVNLRASEWMMQEIQNAVVEASGRAPKRMIFELTEYTEDVHFARFFGEEDKGTLGQRLTATLLPVLRRMKEAGVTLMADDLLPSNVYQFDGQASHRCGRRIAHCHATQSSLMLSEEWSSVFSGVKFGLEWVIHAMPLSVYTGPQYAAIALYAGHAKDSPAYVAAVTDTEVPAQEADQQAALARLRDKAGASLRATLQVHDQRSFDILPVFEGTVPSAIMELWGLQHRAKEQGGIFFEARFPPAWFYGAILSPPEAQPAESSHQGGFSHPDSRPQSAARATVRRVLASLASPRVRP